MSTDRREMLPKAKYHIYNRGNNKMPLYRDRKDFKFFMKKLKYYKDIYDIKIFVSCLMTNHFHIEAQDSGLELSNFMDALGSVYATYFIDKYKYKGRVFESRFKSSILRTDKKAVEIFRYIGRNPVVAGIAENVYSYEWSTITRENDTFGIVDFDLVDELFLSHCNQNLYDYINSSEDDLWIDPIEVRHLNDDEALLTYNNLVVRMSIEADKLDFSGYVVICKRFFGICLLYGLTKRQIADISGLSIYKVSCILETQTKF